MKSTVYFTAVGMHQAESAINEKLSRLLRESRVLECVGKDDEVAVKVHFGEEGNTGYVRPAHVRLVCDGISARGGKPVLADTNTLYRGRRLESADHAALAREHGFTPEATGAPVFIPDDNQSRAVVELPVNGRHIRKAKMARFFSDAGSLVAVSHFKGHILTGFGGALKNIGMGCATRAGKLAQHCDTAPVVHAGNCVGCGECVRICPTKAVSIRDKIAVVDKAACVGCASCVAACAHMAMFVDFDAGAQVQEKLVEYACALLKGKKGKAGFVNFALRINKECDCWGEENPRIAPDAGIFASLDPVAIDAASYDVVNAACGKNIFKEVHPGQDGELQLRHAADLGIGYRDYDLIRM